MAQKKMDNKTKNIMLWVVIGLIVLTVYNLIKSTQSSIIPITYSTFKNKVKERIIKKVEIKGHQIIAYTSESGTGSSFEGKKQVYSTRIPFDDPELLRELEKYDVEIMVGKSEDESFFLNFLLSWLPILIFIGFWIFFIRQIGAGGGKAMSFGKSKAKLVDEGQPKVTFQHVAGCDEAKEELEEIIEFLKDPQRFQKLGGRIPKGVIVVGPPGTGKTLLARAVAGEADVPFFHISGSDFVEMFVGVGASRVRDLFEKGKKEAPCIIFIDEIDAVGRHRGAGLGGGHDEREQTLNQLLVEMDGFNSNRGVILIAATNRPDVLDPALLRPGRFDRQIVVDLPDLEGRLGILKVHTKEIKVKEDVDLRIIARGTPYFSGADLENLVNESALLAARKDKEAVELEDMEIARDKVMMGPERRSKKITEKDKRVTAYHEAGHTLMGKFLPDAEPIHKVSIIPRGRAAGLTSYLPKEEKMFHTKKYLLDQIKSLMGGRAAEEVIFGEISTGASNDIKRATELAKNMVCKWGMSEKMGPLTFGKTEEQIFLGRDFGIQKDYSEKIAKDIDDEMHKIVQGCYEESLKIIKENKEKLVLIADTLIEREVLSGEEVDMVLEGKELPPKPYIIKEKKPKPDKKVENEKTESENKKENIEKTKEKLKEIIDKIDGAGKNDV